MTIENNAKFVDFQSECEDSTRLGGIESFGVVDVKDYAAAVQVQRARSVHGRK
jgi:hypothetical protein